MEKLAATDVVEYYLRTDGLFYNKIITKKVLEVDDIKSQLIICEELVNKFSSKLYVLSDLRSLKGMRKDARHFAQKEANFDRYIAATAVLVGSGLSKIIGNFLISFNKGTYPTKLFTSEEDAAKWLDELRGK